MTRRPTVLIVDDNRPLADAVGEFLTDRFDVETVYDGEAALERVDSEFDVVLLDRRMPGLSGDEVVAEMRARGLDVPVAMVSGVDPAEDVRDLGYDAFVEKGSSPEPFVEAVEALLEGSESSRRDRE